MSSKWYHQLKVTAVINNVETVLGLVGKWHTDLKSIDTNYFIESNLFGWSSST
jgi:hypothetical protein